MSEKHGKGSRTLPRQERTVSTIRRLCSRELFAGDTRLLIEHGGVEYRLMITRQGKLILTK